MGMPNQPPRPTRLSQTTTDLAHLGLSSKHKRKQVKENKEAWEQYIKMNTVSTQATTMLPSQRIRLTQP